MLLRFATLAEAALLRRALRGTGGREKDYAVLPSGGHPMRRAGGGDITYQVRATPASTACASSVCSTAHLFSLMLFCIAALAFFSLVPRKDCCSLLFSGGDFPAGRLTSGTGGLAGFPAFLLFRCIWHACMALSAV